MKLEEQIKILEFIQTFLELLKDTEFSIGLDHQLSKMLIEDIRRSKGYTPDTNDIRMTEISNIITNVKTRFYRLMKSIRLDNLSERKLVNIFKCYTNYCNELCPYANEVRTNPMLCLEKTEYVDCVRKIKSEAFNLLRGKGLDPYNLPKE